MISLKTLVKKIFQYEARLVLKKYKPKIIAISGSVGKTLTREAIYLVLSKNFFVRKSSKSFTAELGVPLTILGCSYGAGSFLQWVSNIFQGLRLILLPNKYPEWLVLEIDADKPGDLKAVSSIISPDILVMTAIGDVPAHIETFYEIENFIEEKKHLVSSVKKDGVIIYNADDPMVLKIIENAESRKVSCGVGKGREVSGSEFEILYGKASQGEVPTGMSFDIGFHKHKYPVTIFQSIGIHKEYASLLSFAVGIELGLEAKNISTVLNKFTSLPGRMNILPGISETTILDDSYNASPVAMIQALETFKKVKSEGRKIAVLGDMMELGMYSAEEHKKLASILKDSVDLVFCVGFRTKRIKEDLLDSGFEEVKILSFDSSKEVGKKLKNIIQTGDTILVKGSQSMRMEKAVFEVMRYPKDGEEVLVRQESEWLSRTE